MKDCTGQQEELNPDLTPDPEAAEPKVEPQQHVGSDQPAYESMVSNNKFMTTSMNAWDWVWRKEHEPSDKPRFGSLFRLLPGLPEYYKTNLRPHYKTGILGPSFAGWDKAIVGMIGVDLDRKGLGSDELNLQAALEDAKRVVGWLRQNGVRDESWAAFQSGLKGISIHFLPEVFGPLLLNIGPGYKLDGKNVIDQGHKRAAYLALEAVCSVVESGAPCPIESDVLRPVEYDSGAHQTLRLFRIPNSKHDQSPRYKIRLTADEILGMEAKEIMVLALKPRLDLPTVPANAVDPALARMLNEKVEQAKKIDDEMNDRARTLSALSGHGIKRSGNNDPAQFRQDTSPSAGSGSDCAQIQIADDLRASIVHRILALIPNHAWLRDAWNSVPRIGKRNSQSEFDYRLCVELFLLNWNRSDVRAAMLSRPGSNSSSQGQHYVERTLEKASNYASLQQIKRPIERVLSTTPERAIEQNGTPWASWIRLSNLWRPKLGIGRSCRDVYLHHWDVALGLGLKPNDQGWQGPYFLPRSDISGSSHRPCSERTMDKAHVLLQSIRLLERHRIGGFGVNGEHIATSYRVRSYRPEEEDLLIRAGKSALKQLKNADGRLSLSQEHRTAAQAAGKMVLAMAVSNCQEAVKNA